ncbi:MAG: glutathione peroxidase [Steroidobacteraceae bacterium]|jgi:glutathione peroxidase
MANFYDFDLAALDGSKGLLQALRGKVTLVVNVASRCGYTPQYADLESLYQELEEQNFTVLGIPCNQFGAQEPGTPAEIQQFCSVNYGVSFPLAAKIDVNGAHRHPLYTWLTDARNGFPGDIGWNFEKFLIDGKGAIVARYPSGTKPRDAGLLQDLAKLI